MKSEIKVKWYFNSGCLCHMRGNKNSLANLQHINIEKVTFGDGEKGKGIMIETLKVTNIPRLKYILLVEGLQTYHIGLSQL